MNDYLALLTVIVVIAGFCWLAAGRVWRRCRCGAQYCNSCNRRK